MVTLFAIVQTCRRFSLEVLQCTTDSRGLGVYIVYGNASTLRGVWRDNREIPLLENEEGILEFMFENVTQIKFMKIDKSH
jgi:hypothetical protein